MSFFSDKIHFMPILCNRFQPQCLLCKMEEDGGVQQPLYLQKDTDEKLDFLRYVLRMAFMPIKSNERMCKIVMHEDGTAVICMGPAHYRNLLRMWHGVAHAVDGAPFPYVFEDEETFVPEKEDPETDTE